MSYCVNQPKLDLGFSIPVSIGKMVQISPDLSKLIWNCSICFKLVQPLILKLPDCFCYLLQSLFLRHFIIPLQQRDDKMPLFRTWLILFFPLIISGESFSVLWLEDYLWGLHRYSGQKQSPRFDSQYSLCALMLNCN